MGKRNRKRGFLWRLYKEENPEYWETREPNKLLVFKAFIHCEGCYEKLSNCLKDLEGVSHVKIDRENHKIIIRGEIAKDPSKALDTLRKKYSKNVELIVPKLMLDHNLKKEPAKEQQAKMKIVVLRMYLHCEGCANDVKRKIENMEGVVSVELNKELSCVIVRGAVESTELVEFVRNKLGKHAEIVREDNRRVWRREWRINEIDNEPIIMFCYPPQYSTEFLYPNQTFSDENVNACSIM